MIKVLGFMTGTSLDGVDMAVLDTNGETQLRFGPWAEKPMPPRVREVLQTAVNAALNWQRGTGEPAVFSEARRELVTCHLQAADEFLRSNGLKFSDFDALGVHGQTVLHERPQSGRIGRTVQLFDGQAFADATGVPVVCDFRAADVAAGGEGAPLAPVYHRALVQNAGLELPLVVVNLGGVANITMLSATGITAMDTGPANGLMDQWMRRHGKGDFDHEGRYAASGQVNSAIVEQYMAHPYFGVSPPKSLDRYEFNLAYVENLNFVDGMATLSAFTLKSLLFGIDQTGVKPKTVVLAGGGRHNKFLVAQITSALAPVRVVLAEALDWRGGALEAEAFAYMAARSLRGLPISFPGTTGVKVPLTGGVVSYPSQKVAVVSVS